MKSAAVLPDNLPAMYQSLATSMGSEANYVPLTPLSFLSRTADIYPDHTAILYEDKRYSWAETECRIQKMAHALKGLGLGQYDTVSALAFNTPEMFEAHFHVPLIGAVLNAINTRLDEPSVRYILNFAEAKALIVDRQLLPLALNAISERLAADPEFKVILIDDPHADQAPEIPASLEYVDYQALIDQQQISQEDYLQARVDNELNPITINFTSGTSGNPKGVVYHHRGSYLMSMGTIAGWGVPRHPVYLYTVPMFHCNGWGHAWTMTAMAATIVCNRAIVPERIFETMQEHRVTHFGGAPIVLNMLANSPNCPDKIADDRIVYCMTAGAPPPASVLARMDHL